MHERRPRPITVQHPDEQLGAALEFANILQRGLSGLLLELGGLLGRRLAAVRAFDLLGGNRAVAQLLSSLSTRNDERTSSLCGHASALCRGMTRLAHRA